MNSLATHIAYVRAVALHPDGDTAPRRATGPSGNGRRSRNALATGMENDKSGVIARKDATYKLTWERIK